MNAAEGVAPQRLAAPLHRLATRVVTSVEPTRLGDAAVVLRAFVARPSAARYLGAMRTLRATARQQKLDRLEGVAAPRLAAEHLAIIAVTAGLPAELQDLLALLPSDLGTTRRFSAIGQMLTAQALLAAHAETALHDLHEQVGQPDPRVRALERRRLRR
jgi:hypothetical protein